MQSANGLQLNFSLRTVLRLPLPEMESRAIGT